MAVGGRFGPSVLRGPQGEPGPRGPGMLWGETNPTALDGRAGDFYYNNQTKVLWGPKEEGGWVASTLLAGVQGPQGPQGPAGPIGEDGPAGAPSTVPGPQGVQGPVGLQGNLGPVGAASTVPGSAGPAGADGEDGEQGPPGPQGPQGTPGAAGAAGTPGTDGEDGAIGPAGSAGPQGIQGVSGVDGEDGAVGPQGPQGLQGPQGTPGTNGTNGAPGADGEDGAPGAQGIQGPQGPTGPQGIQGIQGPQGAPGEGGDSAEVIEARGGRSTLNKRLNVLSAASSPNVIPVAVGRWYDGSFHAANPGTLAGAADRLDLGPFFSSQELRFDRVAISVSAAVASALAKIVIYNSNDLGVPDQLLYESGTIDCSTTGGKELVVDFTFEANRIYWLGTRHSSTATLRTIVSSSALNMGMSSSNSSTMLSCLRRTLAFGTAAPSAWNFVDGDAVFATPPSVRLRARAL